jgi:photosystem II stability/assembly factor-like uncharacterized protein
MSEVKLINMFIISSHITSTNRMLVLVLVGVAIAILASCNQTISHDLPSPWVRSLSFVDSDYAWISTKSGQAFRTTNGGTNWKILPLQASNKVERLFFLDTKAGWIVNRKGEVWHTIDGGDTWALLAVLNRDSQETYLTPLEEVFFIDPSHGWIINSTSLWRTENGGKDWQRSYPSNNPQEITELVYCGKFATTQHGWLGAENGVVYVTDDGGSTWKAKKITAESVSFIDTGDTGSSSGWLIATDGKIYSTKDNGNTWAMQSDALSDGMQMIGSAYFVSKMDGWVVGKVPTYYSTDSGEIESKQLAMAFRTTNAGNLWKRIIIDEQEETYWRVYFANKDHGWVIGTKQLYRTEDGGASWSVSFSEATSGGR